MSPTLSVVETYPVRDGAATSPTPPINDLAIRVGTVNGSGSQSANLVLLRALYGMGIPCSGKNVFPSNIEGLPTWFHIRANAKGYISHRNEPQILVCMNEPTAKDDVLQLKPGTVCVYRDDFSVDLEATAQVEQMDDLQLAQAIGETTLSLQHEINNPLSALLGNAELLLMEMREKGEKNELLIVIHEQAMRIADVVRRLRRLKDPESVDYVGGTKIINFWKERAS